MKVLIACYDRVAATLKNQHWLPLLVARITLGVVFIGSGWGKIHNLPHVIEFFTSLGIPFPEFQAHLVAYIELLGGSLILLGLFTRLAALPLSITMIVALITAKREDITSFSDLTGISEFLYILLFLFLFFEGAGLVSLDFLISKSRSGAAKRG